MVPADADFFNYLTRGGMPRSAIAWLPVVLRSWPGLVSFGTVKQLSASTQLARCIHRLPARGGVTRSAQEAGGWSRRYADNGAQLERSAGRIL